MYDNELIFRIWSEVPDKNINWFTSSGLLAPIKCNAGNTKQQNYILYQWVLFLEKWCEYWLTKNTILATWFVVRSCFTIVYSGSMYIGNIQWKHCRLETSFEFGNINCILKTYIEYWKHNFINRGFERLISYESYVLIIFIKHFRSPRIRYGYHKLIRYIIFVDLSFRWLLCWLLYLRGKIHDYGSRSSI